MANSLGRDARDYALISTVLAGREENRDAGTTSNIGPICGYDDASSEARSFQSCIDRRRVLVCGSDGA